MKYPEVIQEKADHIRGMITALIARRNAEIPIGGRPPEFYGVREEINLQRRRLSRIRWAAQASETAIRAKIAALETRLGAKVSAKYGDASHLTAAEFVMITDIELLELALGEHPGQHGRP